VLKEVEHGGTMGSPMLLAMAEVMCLRVRRLETLGPLAREIAGLAEVQAALPKAHHFGHR